MTISSFTDAETLGSGISKAHGAQITGGIQARLNEIIAQVNANTTALAGASNPFNLAGTIAAAADFPTTAAVDEGDAYVVTADVVDNDATKTNSGLNFLAGSLIVWDGTTWQDGDAQESGVAAVAATPYTVAAGVHTVLVDTATIAGPSVVNLPACGLANRGRTITVIDATGSGGTNAIAVTPNGTDEINTVNAAVSIAVDYGALEIVSNGTAWTEAPSAADLAAHAAITASAHGKVTATNAAIDMASGAAPANNVLTLNGAATSAFLPKEAVFVVNAGAAALAGDVTISIGTTPGGAEIMGATQLTGLATAGQQFRIALTGLMPAIAGNADLDVTVTIDDTGVGAAATMTGYILGEQV